MDHLLVYLALPLPVFLALAALPAPRAFLPVWVALGLGLGLAWGYDSFIVEPQRPPRGWGGVLYRGLLLAIGWNWLMAGAVQALRLRLRRRGRPQAYPRLVAAAGVLVVLPYALLLLDD